jgi:hypothetical protein
MKRLKDKPWKGSVPSTPAKHKRQLRSGFAGKATFTETPGDVATCPKRRRGQRAGK